MEKLNKYYWLGLNEYWIVLVPKQVVNEVKQYILHFYPNQYYSETILEESDLDSLVRLKVEPFDSKELIEKYPNISIKRIKL